MEIPVFVGNYECNIIDKSCNLNSLLDRHLN